MRQRDGDRRHQVEERKRQIIEAEQERREAILRKNQVSRDFRFYGSVYVSKLHYLLNCIGNLILAKRSKNRNEAKE